jgi:ATP-binding cassette, subfamily B, bacterial MsbA
MRQLMRLLRYVRPYWFHFIPSVILMAMVGGLEAFRVALMRPTFDRVLKPDVQANTLVLFRIPWNGHEVYLQQFVPHNITYVWAVVAYALVASTILKGIADYLGTYLVNYAGYGMVTDLRNEVYNAILRRSVAFFQRVPTGTLLSTIINDIERVQFAMSSVMAEFLQQFFTFVALVILVIESGGKFSLVLLVFVPIILFSARKIGRRVRHTTRRGQDNLAEIQNILQETITGVRIVKAFGMELWEILRFRGASKRLFRANLRSIGAQALSSPLMDIFGAVAVAVLLLLGRDQIKYGRFTEGSFLTFVFAVFMLYNPVRKFAAGYNAFQQALGASSSLFSFMDTQDAVRQRPNAVALPPFSDTVCFENVSFCYEGGEENREILHDIDLEVRRGEVVAIVGSSGAGKSTLVHLIPRFFDVSSGRLLIDGQDVREATLASLRSQIGIVTQETIMFNDTVRNNIAYGQPHVPQETVEAAAKAALAHDFIMALPNGYETFIGERGTRLSGGERQRIAIARALFKNAPILILDEATSALDSESESLVQSALANLMQGRTVFVIAHRLSTVRHADRILVLENGTITDSGTHEDLMNSLGTYRRLYDLQFAEVDVPNGKGNGQQSVKAITEVEG